MKRTICLPAAFVFFSLTTFNQHRKDQRPSILLIVSEDHGQHLSCYGDEVIKTPHLDQM